MKTLKQLLQEKWIEKYGVNSITQPPVDYELIAVREWLEQKRQEWMRLENNDPIQTNLIFSELLGELTQ